MLSRLGSALVLLGLIALVVFVITLPGDPDVRTLVLGASLAALGLLLRRRSHPAPESEAGRFATLRKVIGRRPPDPSDP
ncbi:MAG: hypothetical protein WD906_01985 [Anaerolineales bacterium]